MSQTFSAARNTVSVEITIRGEDFDLKDSRWAILELWDEDELVDLLRDRLQKSKSEVRELLASYRRSASSFALNGDRNELPW